MHLSEIVRSAHENSKAKGFWDYSFETFGNIIPEHMIAAEKVALVHSEVSEWLEAEREDPHAHCGKEGTELTRREEELADIIIRVCDAAGGLGVDLEKAVAEKMRYNLSRKPKHGKKF